MGDEERRREGRLEERREDGLRKGEDGRWVCSIVLVSLWFQGYSNFRLCKSPETLGGKIPR